MSGGRSERPDDPDVAGLAGLYALDALEGEDLARFEQYLAEHPEAAEEVEGFRGTAARLSEVSATPAPAGLRDEVLGRLGDVRQEPQRLDHRRAQRRRPARAVAGVAAAAALIVIGALGGFLLGRSQQEPTGSTELVAQVLRADDAQVVDLTGELSGTTRLVYSERTGEAVVVADGVATPPDDRVYALWRIRDDQAVPAGTFRPDDDGVAELQAELAFSAGDTVGVTVEPDGGSETPTLPIVSSAQL